MKDAVDNDSKIELIYIPQGCVLYCQPQEAERIREEESIYIEDVHFRHYLGYVLTKKPEIGIKMPTSDNIPEDKCLVYCSTFGRPMIAGTRDIKRLPTTAQHTTEERC